MRAFLSLVVSVLVAGAGIAAGLEASGEVQAALAEVPHLVEIGRMAEALADADGALALARERGDRAGKALAQRGRGAALAGVQRFGDAAAAWGEAAALWEELGDRVRRVEAEASLGVARLAEDRESVEGRERLDRALGLAAEAAVAEPVATARALRDAGETALAAKQREAAIRLLSASVTVLESQAPGSLELAESLVGLGRAETGRGRDPATARAPLERALEIARRAAPGSGLEGRCLAMLAVVEKTSQSFAAARELYLEAQAILDSVDPGSYATSSNLTDLGICEAFLGMLDDARRHTRRAFEIREALGAHPLRVQACLANLGLIELFAGDVDAAEPLLERAVALEEEYGQDPVQLARSLINLGNVAVERWRFDVARQRYERALALLESQGSTDDAVGKALGNLRELSFRQGDLEASADYSKREVAFFEAHYPDSQELSYALVGAGNLATQRGDTATAIACQARSLEIRERQAPGSPDVAESLVALAEACLVADRLDEAEGHLRRALEIEGGESAATGWRAAQVATDLADLASRRGRTDEAERQLRRAAGLWRDVGGVDNPMRAEALLRLAGALRDLGRPAEAFAAAVEGQEARLSYLRTSSRTLTEREALAFAGRFHGALDLALTLASEAADRIPEASRRVFDLVVRSRAVVLDELAARNRRLWASGDPELTRLARDLAAARDGVARLVVQGSEGWDDEAYQGALAEARGSREHAERALAAASGGFRRQLARERAGLDEVAAGVSPVGALVSYVRFERAAPPFDATEYAAFVLAPGARAPAMVPLGPAGEIDELVAELRRQIASALLPGPGSGKRATDRYRSAGTRLRERVWDPVAARLIGVDHVLVVPDGALNLLELEALPVGEAAYLVEVGPRVHYLSAERDVLSFDGSGGDGGLLALGDPAFDETALFAALTPEDVEAPIDDAIRVASAEVYRGLRSSCAGFAALRFEPLPDSGDEVEEIAALWEGRAGGPPTGAGGTVRLRGAAASEAAFKVLAPGARVIHLATHGFVLGEGCPSAGDGVVGRAGAGVAGALAGESPLLLSGFALAGANHRQAAGPGEEDGILTAEEVAALDLTAAQWAVLSACDTGVGEVRAGEGVFGLRRAFQVAGSRTLIMSLWPVEDEAGRRWMRALYEGRFGRGLSTVDAGHRANLEVLRQRREAGLSTHPAHWAGFIASGDWR